MWMRVLLYYWINKMMMKIDDDDDDDDRERERERERVRGSGRGGQRSDGVAWSVAVLYKWPAAAAGRRRNADI